MKINTKAFTLIELLAVIVILAIIALIATPIVLNIVKDTKESSLLINAKFYLDAIEQSVMNEKMKDASFNIDLCKIENKKLYCNEKTEELKVEVNGEKPTSGTIKFENGDIKYVALKYSNDKTIVKNDEGILVYLTTKSFAEDSWETIVANVRAGNLSVYNLGDTKEIELTGFTNKETDSNGLYTIRIANTSTPKECATEGYSQTACGFVIEFEDLIGQHDMNSPTTNVGGWKDSQMRTYVNNTIYNALPEGLKSFIIPTTVVSGHGSTSGEENFVSEDKAYLLSTAEIWKQGASNKINNDTARELTRQLDYYKNYKNKNGSIGVTTANYSGAVKKYNGSAQNLWTRSAASYSNAFFYGVRNSGEWGIYSSYETRWIAVAFRIG